MPSEIADHIANISVIDTHTHMRGDYSWEGPDGPDILSDLFGGYCAADLVIAGASLDAVSLDLASLSAALTPFGAAATLNDYVIGPLEGDRWQARCFAADLVGG